MTETETESERGRQDGSYSGIRKQNRGGWDHVISVPKFIHDSHTYIFF